MRFSCQLGFVLTSQQFARRAEPVISGKNGERFHQTQQQLQKPLKRCDDKPDRRTDGAIAMNTTN